MIVYSCVCLLISPFFTCFFSCFFPQGSYSCHQEINHQSKIVQLRKEQVVLCLQKKIPESKGRLKGLPQEIFPQLQEGLYFLSLWIICIVLTSNISNVFLSTSECCPLWCVKSPSFKATNLHIKFKAPPSVNIRPSYKFVISDIMSYYRNSFLCWFGSISIFSCDFTSVSNLDVLHGSTGLRNLHDANCIVSLEIAHTKDTKHDRKISDYSFHTKSVYDKIRRLFFV